MAKKKAPAPKGGKKTAVPVKKVAKKKAVAPKVFKEIVKSARQMDQAVADKLQQERFDSVKDKFDAPVRQTVEEQYLGGVMAEMADVGGKTLQERVEDYKTSTDAYAEKVAAYREAVNAMLPTKTKPPTRWQRFRSGVKRFFRFRSASTGEYVTKEYAEANPDTTVRERSP